MDKAWWLDERSASWSTGIKVLLFVTELVLLLVA